MNAETQTSKTDRTKPPSRQPEKQREYYERFYEKRSAEGTIVCPICLGHYTYFNKSHHVKGMHHLRAVALHQRVKEMKAEVEGNNKYKTLDTILTFEDMLKLPPTSSASSCISLGTTD